jgi:uncharacterized protein YbbK (DUF523 family)/uncharacterized protein YbgA (DUF1722 family)
VRSRCGLEDSRHALDGAGRGRFAAEGPAPIRIGISACLLGDQVRFDGGHKRDQFLTEILGPFVEWVRVCPEVELGLGTPRETLRLVKVGRTLRMMTTRTNVDHTNAMNSWSKRRTAELVGEDLCGYVLKKDSPSCGMERVKVFGAERGPERSGRGLFAAALMSRFPNLPAEEEGRLSDPRLREHFIERVFAYRRLKDLFAGAWSAGRLARFHTAHRMSLLAHSATAYQQLRRLVAAGGRATSVGTAWRDLRDAYESLFMSTMSRIATPSRHAIVLTHMAGHLVRIVDADSRCELLTSIDAYRRGHVPLLVPLTLVRHHVRVHSVGYLADQTYLDPDPREPMLQNHV